MCVCVRGKGSWRGVIGMVGNAMELNLQQISHGPFGLQELLRKRASKRQERDDDFSLDKNNNQEVTEHAMRGTSQLSAVSIRISIRTLLSVHTCIPKYPLTGCNNRNKVL